MVAKWGLGLLGALLGNTGGAGTAQAAASVLTGGVFLRFNRAEEREADELPPLGIILCAQKNAEQVELLELDATGVHVAEYLTGLPPREELHKRLQAAIESARGRFKPDD